MAGDVLQELLGDFLLEAGERAGQVEESLLALPDAQAAERGALFERAQGELHTLKGNAAMMGLEDLRLLAHELEDDVELLRSGRGELEPLLQGIDRFRALLAGLARGITAPAGPAEEPTARGRRGPAAPLGDPVVGSVRVPLADLDQLMDRLAELVTARNRLAEEVARGRALDPLAADFGPTSASAWQRAAEAWTTLEKTLDATRNRIFALRMVPLATLFSPMRRIVHDEALRAGKEVRFDAAGGDTPLDKALMEFASDALGHLVRNAVIHGIESPSTRTQGGKPRQGLVYLTAAVKAGEVQIEVEDDGAGIDREGLLRSAARRGLEPAGDAELAELIFLPGVSTREEADVSAGRGMGMSAVLDSAQRHGGWIEVATEAGRGTCFRLRLPLSVSIVRALLLRADGEQYALPLVSALESVRVGAGEEHFVNHAGVLRWRGQVLPLLDLGCGLGTRARPRSEGFAVIVAAERKLRGILVDEIEGIREIVVRGLDSIVGRPPGVSGSTILSDGRVILILDPHGLAKMRLFVEEPE